MLISIKRGGKERKRMRERKKGERERERERGRVGGREEERDDLHI